MGSLERQAELEMMAIQRQLALSPWLVDSLRQATKTGHLPNQDELLPHVVDYENPHYVASGWDGRVDGVPLFFEEEMRWCTLRMNYGWGFPCEETLDAIESACSDTGRLIDFGAGTGYWTAVLRARGLDVLAVDNQVGKGQWCKRWTDIIEADGIEVVRRNPGVPVLLSWPDPHLSGGQLMDAMTPGRIMLRCGPLAVTNHSLSRVLPTHFDSLNEAPVMTASGSEDMLGVFALRPEPRLDVEPWDYDGPENTLRRMIGNPPKLV